MATKLAKTTTDLKKTVYHLEALRLDEKEQAKREIRRCELRNVRFFETYNYPNENLTIFI
jgi:hypothetical protein